MGLAKKFHPDVYRGGNKDHFKRVLEAYNTLKHPKKRLEYDNKMKITRLKASREYKDFEKKMKDGSFDWSHDMYEEIKKKKRDRREEIDPEFIEALNRQDFDKQFAMFMA